MISVLLCATGNTFPESLNRMFSSTIAVESVGRCGLRASDLIQAYRTRRPHAVLISYSAAEEPVALEVLISLMSEEPEANVLLTADRAAVTSAVAALSYGARGFLRREEFALPRPNDAPAAAGPPARPDGANAALVEAVSEREAHVLHWMSRGNNNAAIGREMGISEHTVKSHAQRVYKKLGTDDRAEAVAIALRLGIIA